MSEFRAFTTSTQVVLEYYWYVSMLKVRKTVGLASLIFLMMYRSLLDIYPDIKSHSKGYNVRGSIWIIHLRLYQYISEFGRDHLLFPVQEAKKGLLPNFRPHDIPKNLDNTHFRIFNTLYRMRYWPPHLPAPHGKRKVRPKWLIDESSERWNYVKSSNAWA